MKNNGSIAILGGMGPQASSKLLEVIITMASSDFEVKTDSDFPEIVLNSIPVPNFIANKENVKTVRSILTNRVKMLEAFNPACFGIACNTAHLLLKDLQAGTRVPFVSIIDEVAKQVLESKLSKIGLLATPVTIKSGLYQKALKKQKIRVIISSKYDVEIVEKVIRNVLAGRNDDADTERLVKVADSLTQKGAQGIILGCTELPLIFPKRFTLPVFDSIEILARALLKRFFDKRQI